MTADSDKHAAALAAVAEVREGMLVGIGSGSTVAHLIRLLGERVRDGLRIEAVATSIASADAARAEGIAVRDFADMAAIDLAIDGADEIDAALVAIKGAGAAMLREKVVAQAAARMAVIADGSKHVARVGAAKLPVEVLPFARAFVSAQLTALGARVGQRAGVVTDNGNIILDAAFGAIADPPALAAAIAAIPGALGHGLFVGEVDAAYIAADGVVTRLERDEMNR